MKRDFWNSFENIQAFMVNYPKIFLGELGPVRGCFKSREMYNKCLIMRFRRVIVKQKIPFGHPAQYILGGKRGPSFPRKSAPRELAFQRFQGTFPRSWRAVPVMIQVSWPWIRIGGNVRRTSKRRHADCLLQITELFELQKESKDLHDAQCLCMIYRSSRDMLMQVIQRLPALKKWTTSIGESMESLKQDLIDLCTAESDPEPDPEPAEPKIQFEDSTILDLRPAADSELPIMEVPVHEPPAISEPFIAEPDEPIEPVKLAEPLRSAWKNTSNLPNPRETWNPHPQVSSDSLPMSQSGKHPSSWLSYCLILPLNLQRTNPL